MTFSIENLNSTVQRYGEVNEKIFVKVLALTAFGLLCMAGSAWAGQMVGGIKLTDTYTQFDDVEIAFQATIGTYYFEKIGTLYGLQFSLPSSPVSPPWPVEELSFDMTSLSLEIDATLDDGLGRPGTDNTDHDLDSSKLTGQGENGTLFSGLSDFSRAPVPEMSAMLLFGTVLIGLAGVGRKLRK